MAKYMAAEMGEALTEEEAVPRSSCKLWRRFGLVAVALGIALAVAGLSLPRASTPMQNLDRSVTLVQDATEPLMNASASTRVLARQGAVWRMASGSCAISGDCVTSPNFPNGYSNHQTCEFSLISSSDKVYIAAFNTEAGYDYLTVNGRGYAGTSYPTDDFSLSGAVKWSSDYSVTRPGWKMCRRQAVHEGVPYIIRNKYSTYLDAELAYDHTPPRATVTVEYNELVEWKFRKQANGYYRIEAFYPGSFHRAELNFDTHTSRKGFATLEHNDQVCDWELRHQRNGYYRLVNRYPGHALNGAELSMDYWNSNKGRATVERGDPVDFEIVPAVEIVGRWRPVTAFSGHRFTYQVETGYVHSRSWTKTSTFSTTVSATVRAKGVTFGGSLGVSHTWSTSTTVTESITHSKKVKTTRSWTKTAKQQYLWQAEVEIKSRHYKHRRDQPLIVVVNEMAATPGRHAPPRCVPGYCIDSSGCQRCHPGGNL